MAEPAWYSHGVLIVEFALVFVILVVVALLLFGNLGNAFTAGSASSNTFSNLSGAFNSGINTFSKPIFIMLFIAVIALVGIAIVKQLKSRHGE